MRVGGLDIEHYDSAIVESLARRFGLNPNLDVGQQLERHRVSVEDFVEAFFAATASFTEMLADLLAFFESASATYSSSGELHIAFDFGRNLEALKFDLSKFREWEWRWQRGTRQEVEGVPAWNHDHLQSLADALRQPDDNPRPIHETVGAWLKEYEQGRWPANLPDQPTTSSGRSGHALLLLWSLWSQIVQASRDVGRDRSALVSYRWTPGQSTSAKAQGPPAGAFDPWLLKVLDSESWSGRVLRGMYEVANDSMRREEVVRSVNAVFEAVPKIKKAVPERIAAIEQLLSLPAWKRRSELYSAWVGCRIVKALGPNARVHAVDGWLRYSFSGTHLATARRLDGDFLYVWAELRSPLEKPKGKGRARAIQPDYSIQKAPITYPESSVLVVECKQYLRASSGGFASALDDYARGRPQATVVLVNHGSTHDSILERVDVEVRSRTKIIGELRPYSDAALQCLDRIVSSLMDAQEIVDTAPITAGHTVHQVTIPQPVANKDERPDAPLTSIESTGLMRDSWGNILLRWGDQPRDLDLHVWVTDEERQETEISYQNSGNVDSPPWAALNNDCRDGSGPEIVSLGRAINIRCAVFKYSNDTPLVTSNAILEVSLGPLRLELHCPSEGNGRWWVAFEYRNESKDILVHGRLADNPSF